MNITLDSLQLLTPAEVAELLKISIGTLNNWRYAGRGPAWIDISDSPGGNKRIRYSVADIKAFQQRGRRIEEKSTTSTTEIHKTCIEGLKRQRPRRQQNGKENA